MANRECYPASLFPLRGDLSAEAGATTVKVIGIQTVSIDKPVSPTDDLKVATYVDADKRIEWKIIPPSALELIAANVDLTAQVADIPTTTLVMPSASGMYRISAYIVVTSVSSPGSTLPSIILGWTDADNSTPQTLVLTPMNTGNSLTTYQDAWAVINALTAVAITYATSGYASGGAAMQFALHIRTEKL